MFRPQSRSQLQEGLSKGSHMDDHPAAGAQPQLQKDPADAATCCRVAPRSPGFGKMLLWDVQVALLSDAQEFWKVQHKELFSKGGCPMSSQGPCDVQGEASRKAQPEPLELWGSGPSRRNLPPAHQAPAGPGGSRLPARVGLCTGPAVAQAVSSAQNALPLNTCPWQAQLKGSLLQLERVGD